MHDRHQEGTPRLKAQHIAALPLLYDSLQLQCLYLLQLLGTWDDDSLYFGGLAAKPKVVEVDGLGDDQFGEPYYQVGIVTCRELEVDGIVHLCRHFSDFGRNLVPLVVLDGHVVEQLADGLAHHAEVTTVG